MSTIQTDHHPPLSEGQVEHTNDWEQSQPVLGAQTDHLVDSPASSSGDPNHRASGEPMTENWEALLSNLEGNESNILLLDTKNQQAGNRLTERALVVDSPPNTSSTPVTRWKIVSPQESSDKIPIKEPIPGDVRLRDSTTSPPRPLTEIPSVLADKDILGVNNGMTALHLCASKGHVRAVEILLEYGIDVDMVDSQKRTALHIACFIGNAEIVALLLQEAAGTEVMDCNGYTPLHIACSTGNYEIVKLLLSSGTNLNTRVGGK